MSKNKEKRKAAYIRGQRDSLKDQEEFLSDLERNLYSIVLSIETSPTVSINHIVNQINIARDSISEFRDELFGVDTDDRSEGVVTILDLQTGSSDFLREDLTNIDDDAMRFFARREIEFIQDEY